VAKSSVIHVKVTGVSSLREVIGNDTVISLNRGSTVSDLIDKLEQEFGPSYRKMTGAGLKETIRKLFRLSINGKLPLSEQNLYETLTDGDEILFFQWTGA